MICFGIVSHLAIYSLSSAAEEYRAAWRSSPPCGASWRFGPPASRWRYQVRRAAIADAAPRITEIAVQNAALVLSDADTCIAVKIADVQLI
jgi:hypothetical protein